MWYLFYQIKRSLFAFMLNNLFIIGVFSTICLIFLTYPVVYII